MIVVVVVVVAGAAGHVGHALRDVLCRAGAPVRALCRSAPDRPLPAGVELALTDLTDAATLRRALQGVEVVFLFTPVDSVSPLAALARQAGAKRGVLLSSIVTQKAHAQGNAIAARHAAAEQAMHSSGLPGTLLRPDTFAANALDWAAAVRAGGVVRLPYPLTTRCPIHERDIAEIATLALPQPSHEGKACWITCPQTLTQTERVRTLARAIGRPLRLEEQDPHEALIQWSGRMPVATAHRRLDCQQRSVDQPSPLSPQVARLLGRPALSFEDWAHDHRADFIA
jgi:uncharacterized protein YbjT (DUF2867 family)